jgi:hypothetical protein
MRQRYAFNDELYRKIDFHTYYDRSGFF